MAPDSEPTWTTHGRDEVYRGRVRLVDHAVVLADGTTARYEVDESIPFAVATLVVDGEDLILTRQYRYPIGRWITDLPGGAGGPDETPEEAAARELEEELGLVASEVVPLHTFFVNPGRAAWPVHLFLCADGTSDGLQDLSDPAEQVRHVRMSVRELDAAIAEGGIVDPSLIVARACAAARGLLPPVAAATR